MFKYVKTNLKKSSHSNIMKMIGIRMLVQMILLTMLSYVRQFLSQISMYDWYKMIASTINTGTMRDSDIPTA